MAPEQTGRVNRSIDSRSDLYSLGVTFYEMLTGGLPFTGADPMEWVHCHIARQPAAPSERLRTVPVSVSAITMKLLSKTAEERYQTAAGVESDLRRCLSQWESDGFIDDFAPGTHDTPDRLMIPERLYGRDRDVETLLTAFDRIVAGGRPELVLISGYSGIGKSAVVNELNSEKPDWRATAVTRRIESALVASQQPANWLASIPGGTMKLPEEHRRRPRRIAARVPLRKHV
jgi:serine/threonine protein kinase